MTAQKLSMQIGFLFSIKTEQALKKR